MENNDCKSIYNNQKDGLSSVFINYFTFKKSYGDKFTDENINDAINCALYYIDWNCNKVDSLRDLIEGFGKISDVAKYTLNQRELNRSYWSGGEHKTEVKVKEKSNVMSFDEVVAEFGIAANSLKSKQWRDAKNFPYQQFIEKGAVIYYRNDITKWIEEQPRKEKTA